MKLKIITGGTGFIGSAICWKLNLLGFNDIILVDNDINGTKANNIEHLSYMEFIEKDIFLQKLLSGDFNGKVSDIYHMGACSSTTESDMEYLKRNNVDYSRSLAEWCLKNDARFIYASSAATYGNGSLGFDDDHSLIPQFKPLNKYGLSKQIFDMWLLENNLLDKVTGLKYFNVFGPNETHKADMRSMVNKAYGQISETGKINLFKSYKSEYKDGEQYRDFVYIKDAVEMTVFFDSSDDIGSKQNGIYNIGSGEAHTWLDLANAVFKSLDTEPKIEFIEMPDNIRNQYQYYSKADISKLYSAGYKRNVADFYEAVNDYVTNYLIGNNYLRSNS